MAEDAAVLLADFVSSLDNLPSEVCHILEEISHKEGRVSDLKSRATQRDQAIQKHARPASQGGQGLLVSNPKEESSIKKIKTDYENAELATREKVALSERGVNLLSRHLNRLQTQLDLLTSSAPPLPTLPSFAPVAPATAPATAMYTSQPGYGAAPPGTPAYNAYGAAGFAGAQSTPGSLQRKASSTPAQLAALPAQMAQYNTTPYAMGSPAPGTPLGTSASRRGAPSRLQNVAYGTPGAPPQLAQMGQTNQSNLALLAQQQQHQQQQQQQMHQHQMRLALQAQALSAQQAASQNQQLQMLQQQQQQLQQHGNKRKRQEEQSPAPTVEEESGEAEDLTPYCFCHRPSFGEMIGCDAPDCKIEWFHLNCVGLKTTPEGSWFCSQCEPKIKAQQQSRSRRK